MVSIWDAFQYIVNRSPIRQRVVSCHCKPNWLKSRRNDSYVLDITIHSQIGRFERTAEGNSGSRIVTGRFTQSLDPRTVQQSVQIVSSHFFRSYPVNDATDAPVR